MNSIFIATIMHIEIQGRVWCKKCEPVWAACGLAFRLPPQSFEKYGGNGQVAAVNSVKTLKDKIKTGDMNASGIIILKWVTFHLHTIVPVILEWIGINYIYISLFYCLIRTRVQERGFRCEAWMPAVMYHKTYSLTSVLTLMYVRCICSSLLVPQARRFPSFPDCCPSDGALPDVRGLTSGQWWGTECSSSSGHSSSVWRENRTFMHTLVW